MNSVMVGMFDTQAAAQDAKARLLAAGFSTGAVTITEDASGDVSATSARATTAEPDHEGAISRFFRSIFGDDDGDGYGDTYREAIRRGHYGVGVSTASDDETDSAESILNACGAIDVDERSQQWRSEGWTGGSTASARAMSPAADTTAGEAMTADGKRTINVVEEELNVGKRTVARGGVRVFSRVVEVPVEESVHLLEEHVNVQRRAVDRPATEADFAAFKEDSIEVRATAEEAVVSKDARVVGEVEIGKTVTEHDETVRDTVRKTEVDVEQVNVDAPSASETDIKVPKPL